MFNNPHETFSSYSKFTSSHRINVIQESRHSCESHRESSFTSERSKAHNSNLHCIILLPEVKWATGVSSARTGLGCGLHTNLVSGQNVPEDLSTFPVSQYGHIRLLEFGTDLSTISGDAPTTDGDRSQIKTGGEITSSWKTNGLDGRVEAKFLGKTNDGNVIEDIVFVVFGVSEDRIFGDIDDSTGRLCF
jgi:hypothetical protein